MGQEICERNEHFRLDIYTEFAQRAHEQKLRWVVLHGTEGYPATIGRDLDVYCDGEKEIERAAELFMQTANKNSNTGWVIFPNPLWGRRVLAISKNYEVAELHILYKINSGFISCNVDFSKVDYSQLFPTSEEAHIFKSIVMPTLKGSRKVLLRVDGVKKEKIKDSVWHTINRIERQKKIYLLNKINIYFDYAISIGDAIQNVLYSLRVKFRRRKCPTTPVVYFEKFSQENFDKIKARLEEVFLDFKSGDKYSKRKCRFYQARQELIYFTTKQNWYDVQVKCDIDKNIENIIVDEFKRYNEVYAIKSKTIP